MINKINFSEVASKVAKKSSLSKVNLAPSNDVVTLSSKIQKASTPEKMMLAAGVFALGILISAGLELLSKKSLKNTTSTIEAFKTAGGMFQKGVALTKKGKKFSGTLIHEAKNNKFVMEYKDGLLQRVDKNPSVEGIGEIVKKYTYNQDGTLASVTTSKCSLNEFARAHFQKLTPQQRSYIDIRNFATSEDISKATYTKGDVSVFVKKFENTAEGIRRSKMSDEEIEQEARKLLEEAFKRRGLDESLIPNFKLISQDVAHGGSYNSSKNILEINPEAYRAGIFNLEDVVEHEVTHCENAILRACLPKDEVEEAVKNKLLSRILDYDFDEVVIGQSFFVKTTKTPKMSQKMRKEFAQFALDNLYGMEPNDTLDIAKLENLNKGGKLNEVQQEFYGKIFRLVEDNPDFVTQFSSKKEAIDSLYRYALSHIVRYNAMVTGEINIHPSKLPKLSPEEHKAAIKSLQGYIETMEGNLRINNIFVSGDDFNAYQFSAEEVEAQLNGNRRLIKDLERLIVTKKADGTLTPALEANYQAAIKKAQQTIDYKQKGYIWYQKFLQSEAQPDNLELKQEVEEGKKVLDELSEKMKPDFLINGVYQRIHPKN